MGNDYNIQLREDIQNAFNHIKRMTVAEAYKFLTDPYELRIIFTSFEENLTWNYLYERVEEISQEENWPIKESSMLVKLLHSRKKREDEAKSFLQPYELKLFYEVENKSIDDLYYYITEGKQCIFYKFAMFYIEDLVKIYKKDELKQFVGDAKIFRPKTWSELQNAVKFSKLPQDIKNSLYSVLQFRAIYHKNSKDKDEVELLSSFDYCFLCWRPVPMRFMSKNNKIVCHFHRHGKKGTLPAYGKGYERAFKILKDREQNNLTSNGSYFKKRRLLINALRKLALYTAEQEVSILAWYSECVKAPAQGLKNIPCKISWPSMEQLSPLIPNILEAIGADISKDPTELVDLLIPILPEATTCEHTQMEAMKSIWKQIYTIFVVELAEAELWFEQCKLTHKKIYFPA